MGQKVEIGQCIQDEVGNLLLDKSPICGRRERYFSIVVNAISGTIDRAVIGNTTQGPIAFSLGNSPRPSETEEALGTMANC